MKLNKLSDQLYLGNLLWAFQKVFKKIVLIWIEIDWQGIIYISSFVSIDSKVIRPVQCVVKLWFYIKKNLCHINSIWNLINRIFCNLIAFIFVQYNIYALELSLVLSTRNNTPAQNQSKRTQK